MKKNIILGIFILSTINIFGQILNEKYIWSKEDKNSDYDFGIFELETKNDSLYTMTFYFGYKSEIKDYKNWNKSVKKGVIKKKKGNIYLLTNLFIDDKYAEMKITSNRLIIYDYDKKKKRIKKLKMRKASL